MPVPDLPVALVRPDWISQPTGRLSACSNAYQNARATSPRPPCGRALLCIRFE